MLTKIQQETLDLYLELGSMRAVAKKLGKGATTVRDTIKNLEKRGLVPYLASGSRPEHLNMVKTTVQLNADGTIEREWRRLEPAAQQLSDIVEGLCDKARGKGKVPKRTERKTDTQDILFELDIFDAHVGMFADEKETLDENYDCDIAARRMVEVAEGLARRAQRPGKCVLVFGGDMLHSDSRNNRTELSGHVLDVDTRYHRIVEYIIAASRDVVNIAASIAPQVEIVVLSGNHCFDERTEVATLDGWKNIKDITLEDHVAQWEDGKISYANPTKLHCDPFNGNLISIEGIHHKQVVTPNHHVLVNGDKVEASSLLGKTIRSSSLMPSGIMKTATLHDLNKIKLLTWVVTDGTIVDNSIKNPKSIKCRIQWKLSKQRKIDELRLLLDEMGIPYTFRKAVMSDSNRAQPYYITVYGDEARTIVKELGGVKQFPEYFRFMGQVQFETFLDTLEKTDGNRRNGAIRWTTISKHDVDLVQQFAVNNGYTLSCREISPKNSGFHSEKNQFQTVIRKENEPNRKAEITEVPYDGNVYCLTMPKGTLVTRIDGKIAITGNSYHSEIWLAQVLDAYYCECPNVKVLLGRSPRRMMVFGDNLLVWAHGDKVPANKWAMIIAAEFAKEWGATKHRHLKMGHIHHKKAFAPVIIDEQSGLLVEYLEALCPTDSWHSGAGFVGSQRGGSAFEYHKKHGLMTRFFQPV